MADREQARPEHDPEHAEPEHVVRTPHHDHEIVDTMRFAEPEPRPRPEPEDQVVVVGVDGSAESRAALHWAIRRAQGTEMAVHVVAVWHRPVQFAADVEVPESAFEKEARHWLTDSLPRLAHDEPGAIVRTFLEQGDPTEVLVQHASRADLLVLGNHGRSALAGVLVGSVALRCAQRAPCPVVLVPQPSEESR
jgi:nucleotide-binding universal stress UspA family protein